MPTFRLPPSLVRLSGLCLLLLVAYALRIANIDTYSYWQDEAAQIDAAMAPTIPEVIQTVSRRGIGGVPLDHVLTWVVVRLAGDAEIVLRYLPLMWSLITVALAFRLGDTLQPGVGKWSALAMAFSPLAVAYAREARFYSLGLMLATAVITAAALAARGRIRISTTAWLLCFGLATATAYAHIYSALLWGAGLAITLFGSSRSQRVQVTAWFTSTLACAGLAFLPWLVGALNTTPHTLGGSSLGERQINAILRGLELPPLIPLQRADWLASLYPPIAGLLALVGVLYGLKTHTHRWAVAGLTGACLFGVLGVIVANLAAHYFFAPRQFLFLTTIRAILIGFGLAGIEKIVSWLPKRRLAHLILRYGLAGMFILSAAHVSHLDLYAPSNSVAGPAVEFVLNNYNRDSQDIWLTGIVRFAVDFYVRRSGAPPIRWRTDATAETLKAARPHSLAVVELRATDTTTRLFEDAGFSRVWPPPGLFNRHDLVIYRKEASR